MNEYTNLGLVRKELDAKYFDRSEVIDGLLLGLLTRQHVLLIGAPGTAKTQLARDLCGRLTGSNFFHWLLTRYTLPEEIYGSIDLKALEDGKYLRVTTNKLPEAHVVLLDECFKSGSSIRNTLLTALNERLFFNNGVERIPLRLCIGASNELPDDEESAAFCDRFLLRYVVDYLDASSARKLLDVPTDALEGAAPHALTTWGEIDAAAQEAANIPVPAGVLDRIIQIRENLRREGIQVSDRRLRLFPALVRAACYLEAIEAATRVSEGQNVYEVHEDHLGVLVHAAWESPEQIPTVRKVIRTYVSSALQEIYDARDNAREVWKTFLEERTKRPVNDPNKAVEIRSKVETYIARIDAQATSLQRPKHITEALAIKRELDEYCRLATQIAVSRKGGLR
jgi:MoxR-like ATPase